MGISLGLVGLGSFGSAFAELFKNHPLVDRVGLCDLEPDRIRKFADKESFQDKFSENDSYASLDEICKSDLDALVIITQHWLHAPQAVQAMEAGKHVYSAVPIISIPDSDEILDWCDKLVRTVESTGMTYMYGETTYYRPETMYCRRRRDEGAFGHFVAGEGEYYHDVDCPQSNLRQVQKHRMGSKAGVEWAKMLKGYAERGVKSGPMHYPTHSTCGPFSIMDAHPVKVSCTGFLDPDNDPYFDGAFSNETAQFKMSNGATVRICEYRQIGHSESETFRIFGTQGCYKDAAWHDKNGSTPLTVEEMRDPLPQDVLSAYAGTSTVSDVYGGHGGSHAYLVHEFVDAVAHQRLPAIHVWEAVRYMAAGAAAHKSAQRNGEILDVPDWGDAPPR